MQSRKHLLAESISHVALFGPRAIRGAGPGYPDERTSYLSNAAGLHRAKIVGRHCVDSPPRALHRRIVLAFPETNLPHRQITSDFPKSWQAQELKIFRLRRRANQGH